LGPPFQRATSRALSLQARIVSVLAVSQGAHVFGIFFAWMVALPRLVLGFEPGSALRSPPIRDLARLVAEQAIVFGPRAVGMLAQP